MDLTKNEQRLKIMRQLFTFFGLAYLISWIVWLPLYAHRFGINYLSVFPFQHAVGALGPFIAAWITTLVFQKKAGLKSLLARCMQIKPFLFLIVAIFSPFLLAIFAFIISDVVDKNSIHLSELLTTKEFPQFNLLTLFCYNLAFFGFGEEVGWRGFALPRLQSRMNALTASIVLTVFWAGWHIPLFLYRPGYVSMDMSGIIGWVMSLLTGSILLTWLYNSSRASILICAIFHSTIDIAFTANFTDKKVVMYMGILITVWGILTILIFKPKNLATINKQVNY